MINQNLVGIKTDIVEISISNDEIRQYCEVIGEDNLIFHDRKVARDAGYEDILIPFTYPTLFWQSFDIPWLENHFSIIQIEQSFSYKMPLVANQKYACHIALKAVRTRGNKQFLKHRLYIYKKEAIIATSDTTLIVLKI